MENASKALIIAGAILISILLISLGIMIYNQARSITDNPAMDELQITQFNEKFLQYEGRKSGAQVRSLIQQVQSSNASSENEDKQIELKGDTTETKDVKTTSKYDVTMSRSTEDSRKGLIFEINITKVT